MSTLLARRQVEKPWGRSALPAPFESPKEGRIGEIWFEPPPALPELLVKYIFTSEKLSVQVHPDDDQAEAAGHGRQGKSECWYVIDAQPGAALGIGFTAPIGAEAMRAAALDGSIEGLLEWHSVRAGDFFAIPANTVHAIGAGIALIEVQQNSDITYRLYDYGRPRELHLDEGLEVADGLPHDPALRRHLAPDQTARLVDGPHFILDRVHGQADAGLAEDYPGKLLVIPQDLAVTVAGEKVGAGECGIADSLGDIAFSADGSCLLARPC